MKKKLNKIKTKSKLIIWLLFFEKRYIKYHTLKYANIYKHKEQKLEEQKSKKQQPVTAEEVHSWSAFTTEHHKSKKLEHSISFDPYYMSAYPTGNMAKHLKSEIQKGIMKQAAPHIQYINTKEPDHHTQRALERIRGLLTIIEK